MSNIVLNAALSPLLHAAIISREGSTVVFITVLLPPYLVGINGILVHF
jgi:hypothetical protein